MNFDYKSSLQSVMSLGLVNELGVFRLLTMSTKLSGKTADHIKNDMFALIDSCPSKNQIYEKLTGLMSDRDRLGLELKEKSLI